MPTQTTTAAHVYQREMYKLGHGLAPWEPERRVRPGDVGFMYDGVGFICLFNILLDRDDPLQPRRRLPETFERFILSSESPLITNERYFSKPIALASKSVTKCAIGAGAGSSLVASGGDFSFQFSAASGAVLVTKSPARRVDMINGTRIRHYIRQHIDSWYTFAEQVCDYDIKEGNIMLVTGCDHTAAWAVAAFSERSTAVSIDFRGGFDPIASGGLTVSGDWENVGTIEHRSGPATSEVDEHELIEDGREGTSALANKSLEYNQTIFLRALRIKRRSFGMGVKIKAAAKPQDPESDTDSDDLDCASLTSDASSDSSSDWDSDECDENSRQTGHPLDYLLDYSLRESTCDIAIASDDDLYGLCKDGSILPDDIPGFLDQVSPRIAVDGYGLSYISPPDADRMAQVGGPPSSGLSLAPNAHSDIEIPTPSASSHSSMSTPHDLRLSSQSFSTNVFIPSDVTATSTSINHPGAANDDLCVGPNSSGYHRGVLPPRRERRIDPYGTIHDVEHNTTTWNRPTILESRTSRLWGPSQHKPGTIDHLSINEAIKIDSECNETELPTASSHGSGAGPTPSTSHDRGGREETYIGTTRFARDPPHITPFLPASPPPILPPPLIPPRPEPNIQVNSLSTDELLCSIDVATLEQDHHPRSSRDEANVLYSPNPCGVGGFADVYRGMYNGQTVTIKRLRMPKTSDTQMRSRFEKEISLIRGNFPMWKEPPIGADKNGVKMGELAKPKAFEPYVPSIIENTKRSDDLLSEEEALIMTPNVLRLTRDRPDDYQLPSKWLHGLSSHHHHEQEHFDADREIYSHTLQLPPIDSQGADRTTMQVPDGASVTNARLHSSRFVVYGQPRRQRDDVHMSSRAYQGFGKNGLHGVGNLAEACALPTSRASTSMLPAPYRRETLLVDFCPPPTVPYDEPPSQHPMSISSHRASFAEIANDISVTGCSSSVGAQCISKRNIGFIRTPSPPCPRVDNFVGYQSSDRHLPSMSYFDYGSTFTYEALPYSAELVKGLDASLMNDEFIRDASPFTNSASLGRSATRYGPDSESFAHSLPTSAWENSSSEVTHEDFHLTLRRETSAVHLNGGPCHPGTLIIEDVCCGSAHYSSAVSPVRGSPYSFDIEDVHLHLEEELSAVGRSASARAAMLAEEEDVSNHTLHQCQ